MLFKNRKEKSGKLTEIDGVDGRYLTTQGLHDIDRHGIADMSIPSPKFCWLPVFSKNRSMGEEKAKRATQTHP